MIAAVLWITTIAVVVSCLAFIARVQSWVRFKYTEEELVACAYLRISSALPVVKSYHFYQWSAYRLLV